MKMATDLLFSIIIFVAAGGGFYFTTKNRLDKIESDLSKHNNTNTEILDRLARIETKLDFVTKM
jgi:tetrahydromethanopterin S-methyltransferase subunit G